MIFRLTSSGKKAIIDQRNLGFNVQLKTVVLGTEKYDTSVEAENMTALKNPIVSQKLSGGLAVKDIAELRLYALVNNATKTAEIFEVGLYTDDGILFAVASKTDDAPIIRVAPNVGSILSISGTVAELGSEVLNISVDANSPLALALMTQHVSAVDPHPQYTRRIQQLEARVDVLENRVIEDIKVGELLFVDLVFENSQQVREYKGYGRWEKWGNGDAVVAQGDSTRPEFMRTVGAVGGEDEHTLLLEEAPPHTHEFTQKMGTNLTGDGAFNSNYKIAKENTIKTTSQGGGKPHNNIQRSKVVAVWKRLPDLDSNYQLSVEPSSAKEGSQFLFTVKTTNIQAGQQLPYVVTGLDESDISPSSGHLVVDDKGVATQVFSVKTLNSQPTVKNITIKLSSVGESIDVVKEMPETVTTAIHITKDVITTVRTDENLSISNSINFYDLFVKTQGRKPVLNENVYYIVHDDVAIIGTSAKVSAITVGTDWGTTNGLTLENYGYILGRGGNSGKYIANGTSANQDGGTGVFNNSENLLTIINHSWIAGGGGAGGYGGANGASGAGAPYGVPDSTAVNASTAKATLRNGGSGAVTQEEHKTSLMGQDGVTDQHRTVTKYNGNGGAWGEDGQSVSDDELSDRKERATGKLAGYATYGNILISENSGTIKGRTPD